jgi:hypothetical protein
MLFEVHCHSESKAHVMYVVVRKLTAPPVFWHMSAGLAAVFLSGPAETKAQVHPTQEWDRLCDAYNALPAELQ